MIHFDDGGTGKLDYNENTELEVMKQMNRPKTRRLYTYGIEFSRVESVEAIIC